MAGLIWQARKSSDPNRQRSLTQSRSNSGGHPVQGAFVFGRIIMFTLLALLLLNLWGAFVQYTQIPYSLFKEELIYGVSN